MSVTDTLTITIFNATCISKYSVDSILTYAEHSSLLFLVETWLLPPNRLLTNWRQFHTYGEPRADNYTWIGRMGISLLVPPDFTCPVHILPDTNPQFSKYHLSCIVADTLIHCLYLPPSLSTDDAMAIIQSLPLHHPNATNTLCCGDFNARLGSLLVIIFAIPVVLSFTTGLLQMDSPYGTKS